MYFKQSQCILYSIGVVGGRLRIRRSVSRMRDVLATSVAVRFQTLSKSSCGLSLNYRYNSISESRHTLTGKRVDKTMPHISGPTRNCSPSIAMQTFSQARSILFFRNRITHLPPFALFGSSHIGFMPLLNKCSSRNGFIDDGRTRCEYIDQNCSTLAHLPMQCSVLL